MFKAREYWADMISKEPGFAMALDEIEREREAAKRQAVREDLVGNCVLLSLRDQAAWRRRR